MELLIGALVTLLVGRAIFKGYSATGVLMLGGLALLTATALQGLPVLPKNMAATGHAVTDIAEFVKSLLSSRAAWA